MLPKFRRLSRTGLLSAKLRGQTKRFPQFSLITYPNSQGFNRYSVVTSAKLHKHAVVRNRLRRLIYSEVVTLLGSQDIIIFPSMQMLNLRREDLNTLLAQAISSPSHIQS